MATRPPEQRLRAVCDLLLPEVRDRAGRHEYDGRVPDLSPDGVRRGLARLGGAPLPDSHDEAQLDATEARLRAELGDVGLHRRSPRLLLAALDLSVYDRPYAPAGDRRAARAQHLAAWPAAIDAGLSSLDLLSAPAAQALLPAVRGAAAVVHPAEPGADQALTAHARLVAHLETAARDGDPDPALGEPALTALLTTGEALPPDLTPVRVAAEAEGVRMRALLEESVGRLAPARPVPQVVAELVQDHPDAAGVLSEARTLTAEVLAFTQSRDLVGSLDGDCIVEPSPPSRRWATAMLSWAAPYEPDHPSTFAVTPPQPEWPAQRQQQWLRTFSRTTLPSTTAHEVAPGHFVHGRALRRVTGDVRRTLHSPAFVEGWAHYAEELLVEQAFRADDPRFAIGVAMKALLRIARLRLSLAVHADGMSIDEAAHEFERHAFVQGPAARAEALRAVLDPTYGRYTLGKLALHALREQAARDAGGALDLRRFHDRVLALGAPALGLLPAALAPATEGRAGARTDQPTG